MVAVSIHAYLPFDFAFEGNGHSNWTDSDYISLSSVFSQLNSTFVSKGIPVVIGEFGATGKDNTADREKYAKIYATFAKQYHMPCIWWDNNLFGKGSEQFGIFNRNSLSFTYGGIADAMINVYKGKDSDGDRYISLFWGEATAAPWDQAVSVLTTKNGGKFSSDNITSDGYFYVEYSGTQNGIELILQRFSGENIWAKVNVSESGTANGHYYTKYSYENCVKAFGTSDFVNKLDQIHVGAANNTATVYSVCYCYKNK
jgi:hypothetical protein